MRVPSSAPRVPLVDRGEEKSKEATATSMETLTAITTGLLSSNIASPSVAPTPPSPLLFLPGGRFLHLLLHFLLLSLHVLFSLVLLPLSPAFPHLHSSSPAADAATEGTSAPARALAHVLSLVARVPVASRKYELVRSLAERFLDDNLRFGAGAGLDELNRDALSTAFCRTLRLLEAATAAAVSAASPADRSLDVIFGAVKSRMRRFASAASVPEEWEVVGLGGDGSAEKLAAEALWLAQKMAQSGAAAEAVARWGAAARLGRLALSAEPRLQMAFVRVSVFLFKHADSKQMEAWKGEGEDGFIAHCQMAMLTSWLPLLCHASNGTDSPILSSGERAEMVTVLEEMIEKLGWEQQEEVMALWLHHFMSCPDSDWPNLESCYIQWYSESRRLLPK